jgi:hypothetical protein
MWIRSSTNTGSTCKQHCLRQSQEASSWQETDRKESVLFYFMILSFNCVVYHNYSVCNRIPAIILYPSRDSYDTNVTGPPGLGGDCREVPYRILSNCNVIYLYFSFDCLLQVLFSQFDSPGHTAQFCFYSLMDERGYVLAFYVATKHMVSYSAMMGKFAYVCITVSLV